MGEAPVWSGTSVVQLLEHAPDPVLVVDGADRVRFAGGPVAALLGRRREELVGRPLTQLLRGWSRTAAPGHWSARGEAVHADGRSVPVECSTVPIATDGEALTGIFLRDISQRLALEAENDRVRDDLASNISHELKTPLTSVLGYTELLRELPEEELGPMARRLVEIVHRNAQRELLLVEDLLAVTFTDEQLARMASEPVDLVAVTRAVLAERAPYAEAAGVRLVLEGDDAATVRGDAHHLGRVLDHLVANGCKFSPPGSEVRVAVELLDTRVRVTVADTGIGISEQEAGRVFDRLYRAPGAMARLSEGAGLGLAVARSVVEVHRGTIDLQSRVGVGTTVRVVLPRAD